MKYALRHPYRFRTIKPGYEDEAADSISYQGSKRRAFCAWLLGFNQATIGITAEVLVIIYLSSQSNLLLIIMKFVSLAAVVKFDDMYASILDHSIKAAAGSKLWGTFKRSKHLRSGNEDEGDMLIPKGDSKIQKMHKNRCIKIMRFI